MEGYLFMKRVGRREGDRREAEGSCGSEGAKPKDKPRVFWVCVMSYMCKGHGGSQTPFGFPFFVGPPNDKMDPPSPLSLSRGFS